MTLDDLLKLEESIEKATCELLGKTAPAVPEFSNLARVTPAYEVKLAGVAETVDLNFRMPSGQRVPSQWKGALLIRSVTKRYENSDKHAEMIAAVRLLRYNFMTIYDAVLPHHDITFMRETSTTRQFIADGEFDITEQQFEIMFQIRAEEIPAAG